MLDFAVFLRFSVFYVAHRFHLIFHDLTRFATYLYGHSVKISVKQPCFNEFAGQLFQGFDALFSHYQSHVCPHTWGVIFGICTL